MKTSQELLKKAGILPRLRLGIKLTAGGVKSLGAKRVKVLEDKVIKGIDSRTGKQIEWLRLIVEEGGEKKYYDTKLRGLDGKPSYLVQRFAEIKEGSEIILEMKKQGAKNYIDVIPTDRVSSIEIEDDDTDIGVEAEEKVDEAEA